jgi:prepilin-type N-terminal cleavage/methylation domain-containing protein
MSARRQSGFTLVEVAIVLVIIGLLLVVILKAQELVAQARIKRAIADFTGVSAAFHAYQDRYSAVPGDDPGATRWAGAANGDGNGVVAGAYNSTTPTDESRLWWDHLRRAGFIAGSGQRQPLNAVSGILGVQTGDAAGGSTLSGLRHLLLCSTSLPDKIALAVDLQMDDGRSATGTVRALTQTTPDPSVDSATAPAAYAETGTNVYTVCRQMP